MSGKGIHAVLKLSPALARVCGGKTQMTRNEALKGIWMYIKEHQLQDPNAKKQIVPDAALKDVFGKDRAEITEVMKLMGQHLSK